MPGPLNPTQKARKRLYIAAKWEENGVDIGDPNEIVRGIDILLDEWEEFTTGAQITAFLDAHDLLKKTNRQNKQKTELEADGFTVIDP